MIGRATLVLMLLPCLVAAEPNLDYYYPRTPIRPTQPCLDYYYPRTERRSTEGSLPLERIAGRVPAFLHFPEHKKLETDGSFYSDIVNHHRDDFKDYGDRIVTAHETTHMIHSHLRTKHTLARNRRVNAFYVGRDRFLVLDEPGIKKSDVLAFVPEALRGDRFGLYLENQKEWDDTPLYIFDEWVAYVNGSEVALEEAARKKPAARSNEIYACAEFAVYATALGMAVEKHDRGYFTRNDEFRTFLRWHLQRSLKVYRKGAAQPEFAWKPEYFRRLKSGSESEALRDFWRDRLDLDVRDLLD
jgi:hypothetical protein